MFRTLARWSDETPPHFRFSLKLFKSITHDKGISVIVDDLNKFFHAASGVTSKQGCILIQFPGKLSLDHYNNLEELFQEIHAIEAAREWTIACEFRNESWYLAETWELLKEYNVIPVLHDFKKGKLAEAVNDPEIIYMRFHGPEGDYRGDYAKSFLEKKAEDVAEHLKQSKDVYIYFNNSIGNAFGNAEFLKSILQHENSNL